MLKLIELRKIVGDVIVEKKAEGHPSGDRYHAKKHKVGAIVPEGGSMCANCRWLDDDGTCGNRYFQRWNADANGADEPSELPAEPDRYCCDNWEG